MSNSIEKIFVTAKSGDVEAFERLIEVYQKKVFSIAFKLTADRDQASELAQEVFTRVYKAIKYVDSEVFIPALIYKKTAEVCIDQIKEQKVS